MEKRFLGVKTKRFYFNNGIEDVSYVAIYGDELEVDPAEDGTAQDYRMAIYRGRTGKIASNTLLLNKRGMELYFLDIGQGDASFIVTPDNIKILVDGGLKDRALGFLIWKYRLDEPNNKVVIDHLFLSHADKDHVIGLIPLLNHPKIEVKNIYHNGIGLYKEGHNTALGTMHNDRLITLHDTLQDLSGEVLKDDFKEWIEAVSNSGANYKRVDASHGFLPIGDASIKLEILGPILESDDTLKWFGGKSHTINGHSLIFRVDYDHVRTFFSGDLNVEGSEHLLSIPGNTLKVNAQIFKAPHHGSHEFSQELLNYVNPMVSVVSSGETPDHGHPRAVFLGGLGLAGRGRMPLIFSTELSALFIDAGDVEAQIHAGSSVTTLSDLDFSSSLSNSEARQRFKKVLPGIINVRTDGEKIFAFRRVQMGYQWESYEFKYNDV
ncbi:MBL fold metallo-hydrolase [Maribacter sp. MMG018]|uniref:ComEC/Rec2 family competence protein n=1 Tax=Maribacter sp. MMG018 TaxID=2822688 RepID=UPI001B367104|nr:MBL fold metallo-hydrolase [Maribacter sp. MMG018]MBQ4913777.1 MBL fold metallo-hydrolase [Maribacter sp. MMG018]